MIDQLGRAKLEQNKLVKGIEDSIEKLGKTLVNHQVSVAQPQAPTPANDLASELRQLQNKIGGGNLTDSLSAVIKSLDGFQVDQNSLKELKQIVSEMTAKIRLLAELQAKIPSSLEVRLPRETAISGQVKVTNLSEISSIEVSNLPDLLTKLEDSLNKLQLATVTAIHASRTDVPDKVTLNGPITVDGIDTLLEDFEELKKGFNLLLKKDFGNPANGPMQVEIIKEPVRMTPQPVTNININPLRGIPLSTAITVTTTATLLPAAALTLRRSVIIYNNDASATLYIGGSTVTSTNGLPVPAQTYSPVMDCGPLMFIYGVTSTGSINARVLELSNNDVGGTY